MKPPRSTLGLCSAGAGDFARWRLERSHHLHRAKESAEQAVKLIEHTVLPSYTVEAISRASEQLLKAVALEPGEFTRA